MGQKWLFAVNVVRTIPSFDLEVRYGFAYDTTSVLKLVSHIVMFITFNFRKAAQLL
jgi:hypothetical protein